MTVNLLNGHPASRFFRRAGLALLLAAISVPAFASDLRSDTANANAAPPTAGLLTMPAPSEDVLATPAKPADAASTSAVSAAGARIQSALKRAFSLLGTPYRWGGTTPEGGFDCSGLVGYVFRSIGIDLPRVSREMAGQGTPVTRTALAEGDLVFFGRNGSRVDHVGIYIGDGKFLHAPRTGRDVTVSSLTTGYWSQKFVEARRVATGS